MKTKTLLHQVKWTHSTINDHLVEYCKSNNLDYRYNNQKMQVFTMNDWYYLDIDVVDKDTIRIFLDWGFEDETELNQV